MSVKMRQEVERKIVESVLDALLAAGFQISIDNSDNSGKEYEIERSTDKKAILKAMFLTDDEYLFVDKVSVKEVQENFGWVWFVYGNDGWDVISDYTVNLEKFIGDGTATDKIIEHYSS